MLVRIYRVTLSPAKTFLFGPAGQCRFEPSCSQYAIKAVRTHGTMAGGWLAAKRICRCHPWGQSGEDPVPPLKSKVQSSNPFSSRRSRTKADRCSRVRGREPRAQGAPTLDPRPSTLLNSEARL